MLYVQDPDEEIGRKEYFGSTQVYPGLLFLELDFGRQKELTLKRISIDSFEIQNVCNLTFSHDKVNEKGPIAKRGHCS